MNATVYPLGSDTQHGANAAACPAPKPYDAFDRVHAFVVRCSEAGLPMDAAARYAWARFEATGELPRTAAEFHASTTGA